MSDVRKRKDLENLDTRLRQGFGAARPPSQHVRKQKTRDSSCQRTFFEVTRGRDVFKSPQGCSGTHPVGKDNIFWRRRAAANRALSAKTKPRAPSSAHSMCATLGSSRRGIRDARNALHNDGRQIKAPTKTEPDHLKEVPTKSNASRDLMQ